MILVFRWYLEHQNPPALSQLVHHLFFIVCYIDGPSLRELIRPVFRFATPVTLANLGLGVRIVFALCSLRSGVVVGVDVEALAGGCTIGWPVTVELDGTISSPTSSSIDKRLLKDGALLCNFSIFMVLFWASSTENTSWMEHAPGWDSLTMDVLRSLLLLGQR